MAVNETRTETKDMVADRIQVRKTSRSIEPARAWCWKMMIAGILLLSHQTVSEKIGWSYQGGEAAGMHWPGSRSGAVSWYDPQGDLWLFGGYDYKSTLSDLWKYSHREKRFYYVPPGKVTPPGRFLSSACGVSGVMFAVYGGLREDDHGFGDTWVYSMINNTWLVLENETSPSPRGAAATWCTDTHMYVCGGLHQETLESDLWEFSLETLTWVQLQSASSVSGENSNEGKLLTPNGRHDAMTWISSDRNVLYLYGGKRNSSDSNGYLSDMWSYTMSKKAWSLLSGSVLPGHPAVYGTLNGSSPGGRMGGATWTDPAGNLWLYSGEVLITDESTASESVTPVYLGDIWKYSVSTNTWKWTGGKNQSGEMRNFGVWGNLGFHFTAGARYGTTAWLAGDRYYIFGGSAHYDETVKYLSDLWYMKMYPGQVTYSLGDVLSIIIPALVLVAVFVIISLVVGGMGRNSADYSVKYSLLTESTSFDH